MMKFSVPALALVVEDDPLQWETLSEVLKEENFDVIECESVEAAELVVARAGAEFRLMVTDVRLSGEGDGVELASFTRSRHPHIQVIVVAADNRNPLPADVRLLRKPYQLSELLRFVRRDLHGHASACSDRSARRWPHRKEIGRAGNKPASL
jgi:DNA-binding NtrC family response regulator